MNSKLLSYYNKELLAIRELAKEFARQYPKIASRLDIHEGDIADPYVERLLEGVSFLTARTQLKIDAEYASFVKRIIEVVYPQFLTQTPASAIIKMSVSNKQTLTVLHKLNRGEVIHSLSIEQLNESSLCEFSVTRSMDVTPLQIESALYTHNLTYLPQTLLQKDTPVSDHSALRLDFSMGVDGRCSDLIPEDLPIYLGSQIATASQLLYLLMNRCEKVICHNYENPKLWQLDIPQKPSHIGFAEAEALTFNLNKNVPALRVIQEYIQLPEKFLFVGLRGVKAAIRTAEDQGHFATHAQQIEEVVTDKGVNKRIIGFNKRYFSLSFIFNKKITDLPALVKADDFVLNAVPVVNLFKKRGIRFNVDIQDTEFHVVPDRTQPLNYEVHSVESVKGFDLQNNQRIVFNPLYQIDNSTHSHIKKYAFFSLLRRARIPSEKHKTEGGRSSYLGSEVFLSLVNQNTPILDDSIHQLALEAWCTNRDLPLLMPRSADSDFLIDNALPVHGIKLVSRLTRPKEAVEEHDSLWSLLNLLNFNILSLTKFKPNNNINYFKELLLSFPHDKNNQYAQQVNAIVSVEITPTTKLLRQNNNSGVIRGLKFTMIIDEGLMGGVHPYLFGCIIQQYLQMVVSINTFIHFSIETLQHNDVIQWDIYTGNRSNL